jgi:hypothetical protein
MSSTNAIALSLLSYLGSAFDSKTTGRETIPLVSNLSAAIIPSIFFEKGKNGPCTKSIQRLHNRYIQTFMFNHDLRLVKRIKVEIQDHMENRLQLFFQQLFMVYKTNIDFSYSEKALHQAGLKSEKACPIPLAEAHSSTLPCLLFTRNEKQYVFGSGTSFYNGQNMTVKVPEEVNKVDSWIDKTKKEFNGKSLRNAAIRLIQKVSQSKMNPKAAFQIFIDELKLRLVKFEETHTDSKEKLSCQFYLSVVTSYKMLLVKDEILIKTLCFKRKSTKPVNDAFFLRVQTRLHSQLRLDLRIAEQREKLFIARPLSNSQQIYAKIYLNAPHLIQNLQTYFAATNPAQLKTDWTNVVQVTPTVKKNISKRLDALITETFALIKETYQIKTVQKLGAIIASMLYQASISLNPAVTALYRLPEVANRGPTTRSTEKEL